MSVLLALGSESAELSRNELREGLRGVLAGLGERRRVLSVPPDHSRVHSQSGPLMQMVAEFYGDRLKGVLPALGTHRPMTDGEIAAMYPEVPRALFRVHDWRRDVVTLGEVPREFVREVSEGKLDYPWPAEVNRLLRDGGHDLILSIGQVVPHEVVGFANGNKNIFVGTGGEVGINRSHFLGAVYGMERMMGRVDTPVRRVLNEASARFGGMLPQIVYVLTVVGRDAAGQLVVRGLFVGDDAECFERAAALSLRCNFEMLDRPIRKAVVWLDPAEYRSTWLGNKAVYRTRMAMADGGELLVLAPGVETFGEDGEIDRLIRRFGYCGTPLALEAVREDAGLASNLSAAAHLIHGSSEGRFGITYAPGHLTREEVAGVGYGFAELGAALAKYRPERMRDGWNVVDGEEVFFVRNPGQGLWAFRDRFKGCC